MRGTGIKASELIEKLKKAIKEHGDKQVWSPSSDYPEPVNEVYFRQKEDDGYYPKDVFVI